MGNVVTAYDSFGTVHSFLHDSELPPSRLKVLVILDNLLQNCKLQIELAITIDAGGGGGGGPFIKSTYRLPSLEGDEPLTLIAYQEIITFCVAMSTEHYPKVVAVSNKLRNCHI